jgi:hypothetical protein
MWFLLYDEQGLWFAYMQAKLSNVMVVGGSEPEFILHDNQTKAAPTSSKLTAIMHLFLSVKSSLSQFQMQHLMAI